MRFSPVAILLVVIVLIALVSTASYFGVLKPLNFTSPAANTIFVENNDLCGGSLNFKPTLADLTYQVEKAGGGPTTVTIGPNAVADYKSCSGYTSCFSPWSCFSDQYTLSDTGYFNPIGLFTECVRVSSALQFYVGYFCLKMPADAPDTCEAGISGVCSSTKSYGFSGSTQPEVLLNPSYGQWQYESASFPAYNSVNCPVNNYCNPYVIYNTAKNGSPYQVDPNGTTAQPVTINSFWIYRMFTSVPLTLTPSATVTCKPGTECSSVIATSFDEQAPSELQALIPALNPVAMLDSNKIAMYLQVPQQFYSGVTSAGSNNWYGIFGIWIGGQGVQGTYTSNCTTQTCNIAEASHSTTGMWLDPDLTQGAVNVPSTVTNLGDYSTNYLGNLTSTSVYNKIFTKFTITKFGSVYSVGSNCHYASLQDCILNDGVKQMVVPIVYDIIGSYSQAAIQYTYPAPIYDCTCGGITGKVVDNAKFWHPGISGASVYLDTLPSSTTSAPPSAITDINGDFKIDKILAGGHSIYILKDGYYHYQSSITIVNQKILDLGTIGLDPLVPWDTVCLIPPIQNPIGSGNLFNGVCINTFVLAGLVALGIGVVVFFLGGAPIIAGLGARAGLSLRQLKGMKPGGRKK